MHPLTPLFRRRLFALRAACISELAILWHQWDPADAATWPRFEMPALLRIEAYSAQAAELGAQYYKAMRVSELGAPLPQRPVRPRPAPRPAVRGSLQAVGLAGTYIGLRLGRPLDNAKSVAFRRVARAAGRHVANGWRDSVLRATITDPMADGWVRRTTGTCKFCEMLASEGARPPGTEFHAHDGCACVSEPVFNPAEVNFSKYDRASYQERLKAEAEGEDWYVDQQKAIIAAAKKDPPGVLWRGTTQDVATLRQGDRIHLPMSDWASAADKELAEGFGNTLFRLKERSLSATPDAIGVDEVGRYINSGGNFIVDHVQYEKKSGVVRRIIWLVQKNALKK